jgi:prevent-host-death family protein
MGQQTVGIRQLKEQLSHYVEQVKAGETVVITERGTPVGQIVPVAASLEDQLHRLAQANLLAWSGRKLGSASPAGTYVQGSKTVAELLLEDRR